MGSLWHDVQGVIIHAQCEQGTTCEKYPLITTQRETVTAHETILGGQDTIRIQALLWLG